jgi:hypothetical protein
MTTTWTQLAAYTSILPFLPAKRRDVLVALMDHDGCTGMELSKHMGQDARNVTPRLNELRTRYNAIHKGAVRVCAITGNPVETWWCGPEFGKTLSAPSPQEDRLIARLSLLLAEAPRLGAAETADFKLAAQILGTTERRLFDAIRKERKRQQAKS